MRRIDVSTALASAPVVPAVGTEGYFTNGNPGGGIPATEVPDWFLNMVQEELRAVVVAAGVTPSKTTWTQLRDALATLYGGGGTLAATGWQKLPGGLIAQWSNVVVPGATGTTWSYPIAFPTAIYGVFVQQVAAVADAAMIVVPSYSTTTADIDNSTPSIAQAAFVFAIGK